MPFSTPDYRPLIPGPGKTRRVVAKVGLVNYKVKW
jgi:hypothetical protein